jgi:hypothetical protein
VTLRAPLSSHKEVEYPTTAGRSHQGAQYSHEPVPCRFNMAMLGVICVSYISFVRWKIRLKGG